MASGHQPEEADGGGGELEQHGRRGGGHHDQDGEADHLARGDAVGPLERRARHHGHGHHAVVDVGADERRRGDAEVGPEAGAANEAVSCAGSGIAGP